MRTDTLELLDFWDLTLPPIPPRSRLFCLPPVGIGTAAVESLTGYVARLAMTHGVPCVAWSRRRSCRSWDGPTC